MVKDASHDLLEELLPNFFRAFFCDLSAPFFADLNAVIKLDPSNKAAEESIKR